MRFEPLPFTPIFVTGVPRSGTNFLCALLCTAEDANDYVAECDYLANCLGALQPSLAAFDNCSAPYFDDKGDMIAFHGEFLRRHLLNAWERFGRPSRLVLKSCQLMTKLWLLGKIFPEGRVVVTIRDPRDIVASRLRAERKAGRPGGEAFALSVAKYYDLYYGFVTRFRDDILKGRLFTVGYEALVNGGDTTALAAFCGLNSLHPDKLWSSRHTVITDMRGRTDYFSDLWGKPVSSAGIGRWTDDLTQPLAQDVMAKCAGRWAELLRDENVGMPPPAHTSAAAGNALPGADGLVWAALGDSTTAHRQSVTRPYVETVLAALRGEGLPVRAVNLAAQGATTDQLVAESLQRLPHRLDVATVQIGINDAAVDVWRTPPARQARVSLETFEQNLQYLVAALRARGAAVVLMTPNRLFWTPELAARYDKAPYDSAKPDGFDAAMRDHVAVLRRVAHQTGSVLVDVHAAYGDRPDAAELLLDGVHPNDAGQDLVARLLTPVIRRALAARAGSEPELVDP